MSWYVLDDRGLLRQALQFAQARGVLVVCAAGNNGGGDVWRGEFADPDNVFPTVSKMFANLRLIVSLSSYRRVDRRMRPRA